MFAPQRSQDVFLDSDPHNNPKLFLRLLCGRSNGITLPNATMDARSFECELFAQQVRHPKVAQTLDCKQLTSISTNTDAHISYYTHF